jgi:hypothetical protein
VPLAGTSSAGPALVEDQNIPNAKHHTVQDHYLKSLTTFTNEFSLRPEMERDGQPTNGEDTQPCLEKFGLAECTPPHPYFMGELEAIEEISREPDRNQHDQIPEGSSAVEIYLLRGKRRGREDRDGRCGRPLVRQAREEDLARFNQPRSQPVQSSGKRRLWKSRCCL